MTPSTDQADTLLLGEIVKEEVRELLWGLRLVGPGVRATRSIQCEANGIEVVISVSGFREGEIE